MKIYFLSYIFATVIFLGLDAIWLKMMGSTLYRPLLGDLLGEHFNAAPAIAFYVIYIAGIVYFPISAAFSSGRWSTALIQGAVFGLIAYGTYDLTNQATLRHWSTTITVLDMSWGALLTATSAVLSFIAVKGIGQLTA
jgi:uncharacterized membrane protein